MMKILIFFCLFTFISATSYKNRERIPIYTNLVGPESNPTETYKYYTLPWCKPLRRHSFKESFGEELVGDRKQTSLYDIRYLVDIQWQSLCSLDMSRNDLRSWLHVIKNNYIYELFVDDLSVKGCIGKMNGTNYYLYTHLNFYLYSNRGHVIGVETKPDENQVLNIKKILEDDIIPQVEFSFSATWLLTDIDYANRMGFHWDLQDREKSDVEIHWLSLINSSILGVSLTGFLVIIFIQLLRKDLARYIEFGDEEKGEKESLDVDDIGWKLIHRDVFRSPPYLSLFTACLGSGAQLLFLITCIMFFALLGMYYPSTGDSRGLLYSTGFIIYALAALFAGHYSGKYYSQLGGKKWALNATLTSTLFSVPLLIIWFITNTIAWIYSSTTAIPFHSLLIILFSFTFINLPLTILSFLWQYRKERKDKTSKSKVNNVHRQIPPLPFQHSVFVHIFLGGFLPFSSIYIEVHYLMEAMWAGQLYTFFGILCLTFILLIIVTCATTVSLTYFQLSQEDWRWWWRSFLSAGCTGVFFFLYSVFYYFIRSNMSGVLQFSFFMGYMLLISYALFLLLGFVGYHASSKFVFYIYSSQKLN